MLKKQEDAVLEQLISSDLFIDSLFPIPGNYDLAVATTNLSFNTVLDVGFGRGGASIFFAVNGKKVKAIGLETESYGYPKDLFERLNINTAETEFLDLPGDTVYDAIWMSHVLEHTLDVGTFLRKAWQLLSVDGWLFVMVPPYKASVVGGHVTTGWNLGQLMYGLLLCGFDIRNGHFIKHGYNLCAFVRKSSQKLPPLRFDIGDIEATAHLWPIEAAQGFNGDLQQVNWFNSFVDSNQRREAEITASSSFKALKERLAEAERTVKERSEQLLKLQNEFVSYKKEFGQESIMALQEKLTESEKNLKQNAEQVLKLQTELGNCKNDLDSAMQSKEQLAAQLREASELAEQLHQENKESLAQLAKAQNFLSAQENIKQAIKTFSQHLDELSTFSTGTATKQIQCQEGCDISEALIGQFFSEILAHLKAQDQRLRSLQELVRKFGR